MSGVREHETAVRDRVEDEPGLPEDHPASVGRLQRICRAASRDLPASGVGLSVVSGYGALMTAAASSPRSVGVEQLQFSLGEGPCIDVFSSVDPVLVPDLAAVTTWPGYAPAAQRLGVRAVFAFPLRIGAAPLGVLDVYRERPGSLSSWAFTRAETYARAAVTTIVDAASDDPGLMALATDGSSPRLEVFQAQGMVMVQLGVSPEEALARMRARAFAQDRPLADVADDIIARKMVLESDARDG